MNNLVLVNKIKPIRRDYIPNHMVVCDKNENNFHGYIDPLAVPMISKEVYDSFKILKEDALKDGFNIIVDSGYRSYNYQGMLWKINLSKNYWEFKKNLPKLSDYEIMKLAEDLTNRLVALPGHSEHQTGLALDFAVMNDGIFSNDIEDSEESKWMMENAYKYGFIMRYPKGKENITGYNYEPWHYRYVGLPYSEDMYNDNLTLEEYHKLVLKK